MPRLTRAFFSRDTHAVAYDLLGKTLVHRVDGRRMACRIVELEVYTGWGDMASHGHRGPTKRNAVMFGPPGVSYVYLIYGMYWLLNIVAKPPDVDYPAAILLRALEPTEGLDMIADYRPGRPQREWTSGPGRLTMALGIDGSYHGLDITAPDSPLFVEDTAQVSRDQVKQGPRIGINVPEPWKSKPWRYWVAGNPYISKG